MSYRAIRSMMDLLVTGMIHRTEYDVKTKEPPLCLLQKNRPFVFYSSVSQSSRSSGTVTTPTLGSMVQNG